MSNKPGYPDLHDPEHVYEALVKCGMFSDKFPPCFTSRQLLDNPPESNPKKSHNNINYMSYKHTGTYRQFGIPHPEAHLALCQIIRERWDDINKHVGKPDKKFSFLHVRKIKDKEHIFEMNYKGIEKLEEEDNEQGYYLGSSIVVQTDISTCFPSIYSHSIPWAIQGKTKAKKNRNTTDNNVNSHWSNDLDRAVRNCNDQQTKGLLIGPHTSNIISEIILTAIDQRLQKKGFEKVIRNIDDYKYFAKDEIDAKRFIRELELALKEYELQINQKKTKIIPLTEYFNDQWHQKLARFSFPVQENIGFKTINSYLSLSISLAKETYDFSLVNYAIKVLAGEKMSIRARKLYLKKILALSLEHPYLVPLLEEYVFKSMETSNDEFKNLIKDYLEKAIEKGIKEVLTDLLAFAFYLAIKYKIALKLTDSWQKDIVALDDCISTLLAWKYNSQLGYKKEECPFHKKYMNLKKELASQRDEFWLFLYEYASGAEEIDDCFLKQLKEKNISFIEFDT